MNAPEGKRPLAAIQDDINQWVKENTTGAYRCRTCDEITQQTTLYATVHMFAAIFSDECVGDGEVVNLALPYCNTCEPEVARQVQRTCIHEEKS